MDLVSRRPLMDLYDREWPIRSWQSSEPPAKSVHGVLEDGTLIGGYLPPDALNQRLDN